MSIVGNQVDKNNVIPVLFHYIENWIERKIKNFSPGWTFWVSMFDTLLLRHWQGGQINYNGKPSQPGLSYSSKVGSTQVERLLDTPRLSVKLFSVIKHLRFRQVSHRRGKNIWDGIMIPSKMYIVGMISRYSNYENSSQWQMLNFNHPSCQS
jgi:hypothetical protein